MIKTIAISFLLAASAVQAGNYFPISAGNRWTYRSASGESFEIVISAAPIQNGEHFYHKITGYATQPLYVRAEGDRLYWLNEEQDREEILADFKPFSGGYYTTPISAPCGQDAQAQERPVEYEGGGGMVFEAREIRYRIYDCADTGVESELYIENIGLARRVVQTIAGPREFNLTSANVGPLTLNKMPGVQFRVSMPSFLVTRERPGEAAATDVTLDLLVDRMDPLKLKYTTSQRYDIAIKNERGETVYFWSATALFAQVASEESVVTKQYVVPLALTLPDGNYQLEAWLTTASAERQFSATTPLTILTEIAPASSEQHFRARAVRR
ncbi:MAG: BsuPI-related putative proteinase inhibitor [Bryobacterales bacterium]